MEEIRADNRDTGVAPWEEKGSLEGRLKKLEDVHDENQSSGGLSWPSEGRKHMRLRN